MQKNSHHQRGGDSSLKLSLELSSDTDSEYRRRRNVNNAKKKSPPLPINADEEEDDDDFENSGRKNKTVLSLKNSKNVKKKSISGDSSRSTSRSSSSSSSSSLAKHRVTAVKREESRSRSNSSGRTMSRSSSRPDSRKKKVSFNHSRSNSDSSVCSSKSSSSSSSSSGSSKNKRKSRKRDNDDDEVFNKKQQLQQQKVEKLEKPKKKERHSSVSSSMDETPVTTPKISHLPKVFVKPPLDTTKRKSTSSSRHHRRSPSLEKPSDDNNNNNNSSEFVNSSKRDKKVKNRHDKYEEESSGAEMTDVSPLPSPFQPRISITPKLSSQNRATPTLDTPTTSDKLKLMKFNEVFDMRDLMKSIDDTFDKLTHTNRSTQRYHSNENLASSKSDKQQHQQTRTQTLRFLSSNSQLLESNSDYFNSIMPRSTQHGETPSTKKKKKTSQRESQAAAVPMRVTSAALNRMKEQQRIERANRTFLKRLLEVKPTKELNRDEQLKDYYKHLATGGAYFYSPAAQSDPSNATALLLNTSKITKEDYSQAATSSSKFISRTASVLANHFTGSTSSFRPSSATAHHNNNHHHHPKSTQNSRPSSAKSAAGGTNRSTNSRHAKSSRPVWDDRW